MTHVPKAYNELVSVLLTDEDRAKFEWAIGAILCGGPRNVVIFHGGPATGKSTLLDVIRKVMMSPINVGLAPRVALQHDGYFDLGDVDAYVFAAVNRPVEIEGVIDIHTTGDRVPVNKHYVLMEQIGSEGVAIAEHCINVYHNTPNTIVFNNPEGNNR